MKISENIYEKMLESMTEGIYFVDLDRKITFWNKGAEIITGFKKEEMLGHFCYDNILNHVDEAGTQLCSHGCPLHASMQDEKERNIILYLHHKNGHRVKIRTNTVPIYDQEHCVIGCAETFIELKEGSLKILEEQDDYSVEQLRHLALYDQLTGLPNRRYLETYLRSKLTEFEVLEMPFGVIFMDIDDFRYFNNSYGHELGDKVLKVVSNTFINAIRKSDIIGRWGGEEFIGIFTNLTKEDLAKIAEKIRMLVEQSILREADHEHHVTISIGASMVQKGDTIKTIIERADQQMYLSKKNGKNQVHID